MFGHRTPPAKDYCPELEITMNSQTNIKPRTTRAGPSSELTHAAVPVRKSIGDIEDRIKLTPNSSFTIQSQNENTQTDKSKNSVQYKSRLSEAKACLLKIRLQTKNSKNLKTEIKDAVIESAERLYNLVKQAEEEGKQNKGEGNQINTRNSKERDAINNIDYIKIKEQENELTKSIEKHYMLLKENKEEMKNLKQILIKHQEIQSEMMTYAKVTAGIPEKKGETTKSTIHSIAITSKDENETGDQVYDRIRTTLNAKEDGIKIDKIRKAKDRKVIIGCRVKEELGKIKNKLETTTRVLNVEEIKNKNPLIILYGVLNSNSDDDIIKAIRSQNKSLLKDLDEDQDKMEVRFRKKARNPLTAHVILRVSPSLWCRFTEAGSLHIDMQKVRVADQSPLVQCTRCLGYGHSKRFCTEKNEITCSHCGGPHLKADCQSWSAGNHPSCINCAKAKIERKEHNAFDSECPVRMKWEDIARSMITYC